MIKTIRFYSESPDPSMQGTSIPKRLYTCETDKTIDTAIHTMILIIITVSYAVFKLLIESAESTKSLIDFLASIFHGRKGLWYDLKSSVAVGTL